MKVRFSYSNFALNNFLITSLFKRNNVSFIIAIIFFTIINLLYTSYNTGCNRTEE